MRYHFTGGQRTLRLMPAVLVLLAAVSAANAAGAVGGWVRDPLGRAIERVEVFLVPERAGGAAALSSASDALGQFVFPAVPAGFYRVAAVKDGYAVYLGRINTALRSSIDLVLHPLPMPGDPGAAAVPSDPAWALRLPRRSVWQELLPDGPGGVPETLGEPEADPQVSQALAGFDLGGVVDQTFAIAASDTERWAGGVQGQETRLGLTSSVGEATRLRLQGYRRNSDAAGKRAEVEQSGGAEHAVAGLAFGMSYVGSSDSAFDVDAYYSRTAFDVEGPVRSGEAESLWGATAAWSMQLDSASKFGVVMDYGESSFEPPDPPAMQQALPALAAAGDGRWLGAEGTYEAVPASGHQVVVGFRAQFAHLPVPVFVPAAFSRPLDPRGEGGWNVHLHAEDSWSVATPLTLTYGLGYRHRLADQDVAIVIPRFGAIWNAKDVQVRGVVSYHTMSVEAAPLGTAGWDEQETRANALGYEVDLDAGLSPSVRLRTSLSYAPIQETELGFERTRDIAARPLYLTDGQAAVFEASAAVAREVGATTAYLESASGRVEGRISAVLPFDTPLQTLSWSRLDYRAIRVGVRVAASGTDLRLEHRRVSEVPDSGAPARPSERDDVMLRLLQDVATNAGGAAWRLLVAVQSIDLGDGEFALARIGGTTYRLPASHYQVNAGMSIAF